MSLTASLPWFPIVPRNAPTDDLRDYLELYSQEAVVMRDPQGPNGAEWYVNTPVPRMRALRGVPVVTPLTLRGLESTFAGVGEPMGPAPELRFAGTGVAVVSALWAQRAVNAWNAAHGIAARVVTDGISGPQTLGGLRTARLAWLAELPPPISTSPRVVTMPAIVDRTHVSIAGDFYDALGRLAQVADVPAHPPSSTSADAPTEPAYGSGASSGVVLAVALGLGAAMWFGRRR